MNTTNLNICIKSTRRLWDKNWNILSRWIYMRVLYTYILPVICVISILMKQIKMRCGNYGKATKIREYIIIINRSLIQEHMVVLRADSSALNPTIISFRNCLLECIWHKSPERGDRCDKRVSESVVILCVYFRNTDNQIVDYGHVISMAFKQH